MQCGPGPGVVHAVVPGPVPRDVHVQLHRPALVADQVCGVGEKLHGVQYLRMPRAAQPADVVDQCAGQEHRIDQSTLFTGRDHPGHRPGEVRLGVELVDRLLQALGVRRRVDRAALGDGARVCPEPLRRTAGAFGCRREHPTHGCGPSRAQQRPGRPQRQRQGQNQRRRCGAGRWAGVVEVVGVDPVRQFGADQREVGQAGNAVQRGGGDQRVQRAGEIGQDGNGHRGPPRGWAMPSSQAPTRHRGSHQSGASGSRHRVNMLVTALVTRSPPSAVRPARPVQAACDGTLPSGWYQQYHGCHGRRQGQQSTEPSL